MSNRLPAKSFLDEPCDIHAEIGSRPWSLAVAREIRFQAKSFDTDVKSLQRWIEIAAEHEAWRTLGYISLDSFLIVEANFSQSIIDSVRRAKDGTIGDAVEAAIEKKKKGKRGPKPKGEFNNNVIKYNQGPTTENTLRRLARDCPELLDEIKSGALSVNAAAIKAGIRKKLSHAEKCVAAFRKAENRLEVLSIQLGELEECELIVLKEMVEDQLANK